MVTVYVTNTNTGACEEIHCRTKATAEIVVAQLSQVPARELRVEDPEPVAEKRTPDLRVEKKSPTGPGSTTQD